MPFVTSPTGRRMGVESRLVGEQQQVRPRGGDSEGERPGDNAHLHSILGELDHSIITVDVIISEC